jgi:hypothetical protein
MKAKLQRKEQLFNLLIQQWVVRKRCTTDGSTLINSINFINVAVA